MRPPKVDRKRFRNWEVLRAAQQKRHNKPGGTYSAGPINEAGEKHGRWYEVDGSGWDNQYTVTDYANGIKHGKSYIIGHNWFVKTVKNYDKGKCVSEISLFNREVRGYKVYKKKHFVEYSFIEGAGICKQVYTYRLSDKVLDGPYSKLDIERKEIVSGNYKNGVLSGNVSAYGYKRNLKRRTHYISGKKHGWRQYIEPIPEGEKHIVAERYKCGRKIRTEYAKNIQKKNI